MDFKSVLSLKQLSFIISRQENQKKWFWYDGKITKSKRVSQKRTSIVKDGEDLNGFGLIWFYIANNTEYNLVLCFENAPAQNQCYVRETTIQRLKSLEVLFSSESSSMSNEHLENFPKYCLRHDQGYAHVCKDHSKKPCDTT